ncbi:hypothetical protein NQ314_017158 [Rhamnusium bicolor]|uniref:Uncharacterized protein n=1 Tax=Rhamnusium bicolor TaxID=1586634 RepID=A0AAV8WU92_9CUCU|nr:hypothetical protein NQ314_017158 [Rhamnusium bicolor]
MKWSKKAPTRGKTLSTNLLRFVPGLKGEILRNPPSDPLESWRYFFENTNIENIVKYTNQ